jgi:hypothetical protein
MDTLDPNGSAPSGRRRSGGHGGNSPRCRQGDELFYLDAQSNHRGGARDDDASFAVHGTRVLFNASDFIQTAVSRRNYDVSADDQRFSWCSAPTE